ncbi:hypothetical protein PIB30_057162 [Stylosanthes scabra]|uniref:Uncharacterized protein n=1 Tax=Stylosanthes scabra TaxID=79078 RepID=A0ABU6YIF4_9FABA|nr:hypothetical protein [Stylosanthes scabra]
MMKRTPSRNNRSKGLRVKHVLQIVVLLGVCFWLIYQVKHNHDKKKEYDENDEKLLVQRQRDQSLKLGRKDLHPVKDEVIHNEKHEEEEEDENVVEDEVNKHEPTYEEEEDEGSKNETEESEDNRHEVRDQREEENKLDAEEQEEDENKSEEMEDERRGVGDDEIDENDQEKTEVGTDRVEEFVDEEKEKEDDEKENENGEGDGKGELVENHNTREAREEHYKGDDASSAVTHDAHTTSTETEALSLENSDVNRDTNKTKPENEATYSDESNSNQKDSDLKVTEGDLKASNATSGIEGGNNTLSNPVDSSNLNETATTNNHHLEASSNMKNVITEASNNSSRAGVDTLSSSDQNKTVILSESDRYQNSTGDTTISGDVKDVQTDGLVQSQNRVAEENLHDSNSTITVKTENGDTSAGESSNLGGGESENIRLLASNETRDGSRNESSDASEGDNSEAGETNKTLNVDGTEDEMFKGDTETGETDEMSDASSANGNSDSVEHDAIDSSDDAKFRTDLDTLPDFRNEGENGDEIASE